MVKKCEINGDLLCDTAGDPNIDFDVDETCDYSGSHTNDAFGVAWTPPVHNIMSYSTSPCINSGINGNGTGQFTLGQIGVILNHIPSFASTSSPFTISGPSVLCPGQNYGFSIGPIMGVDNYQWWVPPGYTLVSGQGTNSVTVTGSNGASSLDMFVSPFLEASTSRKSIKMNPKSISILGQSSIDDDGTPYPFSLRNGSYVTNINWSVWPGWFIQGAANQTSAQIGAYPGANAGYINASASACGANLSASRYITIGGGGPIHFQSEETSAWIYPNPAKDFITIKLNRSEGSKASVRIYALTGGTVFIEKNLDKDETQLDISSLRSGFYLIQLDLNGGVFVSQLLKE